MCLVELYSYSWQDVASRDRDANLAASRRSPHGVTTNPEDVGNLIGECHSWLVIGKANIGALQRTPPPRFASVCCCVWAVWPRLAGGPRFPCVYGWRCCLSSRGRAVPSLALLLMGMQLSSVRSLRNLVSNLVFWPLGHRVFPSCRAPHWVCGLFFVSD